MHSSCSVIREEFMYYQLPDRYYWPTICSEVLKCSSKVWQSKHTCLRSFQFRNKNSFWLCKRTTHYLFTLYKQHEPTLTLQNSLTQPLYLPLPGILLRKMIKMIKIRNVVNFLILPPCGLTVKMDRETFNLLLIKDLKTQYNYYIWN